ncbi:hypothetical protein [Kitasatospora sp. NPDC089509]|uniref:hypothetical protein n=1 Tax=Kitasatospora sp. NPDC089509 TaxID=3364079 RepID=UPI003828D216
MTEAAQFTRLTAALAALLGLLRALPLSSEQHVFFDEQFGPTGTDQIAHRLAMFGEVRSLAFLGITPHLVRVMLIDPAAPRQ